LIEKGICKINDKVECFSSSKLKVGDLVSIEKNWEEYIEEIKNNPVVLYEDSFFIFVNKPCNFLSEDLIKKDFKSCLLVNRLDKETSGILILAKTVDTKNRMIQIFLKKKIKKTYLAIVDRRIKNNKGKIECFLKKNENIKGKIIFNPSVNSKKYSLTYYEVIKRYDKYSFIKCFPVTGKTHQIRVHMLKIGHPILGDYKYNQKFFYPYYVSKLMLHSRKIEFIHPFLKKKIKVVSLIPDYFKEFI